ncbi:hypothetical protein K493DRAFT_337291 [Basidiobolus meristosporus CBS 931.73]|uniref:SPT23/MGA2-like DNA-binding domain-containing protein n=1 Tax=Basidiobolus meristosporus CBS 931.73 TaxID=1314790 RepID=A0A1Y1YBZ4_9FUNG|nr:hypothetical protein K493DRAFT_337291 [Basidiobolus meristosporus CBS 931.73]|eukprot:ORX95561.1 hypothetical protein K493DRAFT_337291 [Basidiobolus meristosporus CBS 931.73]
MHQNRLSQRQSDLGHCFPTLKEERSNSPHFNTFDSAVNTPSEEVSGFDFNYTVLPTQFNYASKTENSQTEGPLNFAPSLQATPNATPMASPSLAGFNKAFVPNNLNSLYPPRPPSPYQSPFLQSGYGHQPNASFQPLNFSLEDDILLGLSQPLSPTATPMATPPLTATQGFVSPGLSKPSSPLHQPQRHPYFSLKYSGPNTHMPQNVPLSMDAHGNIFAIPSGPVSPSATPMASPSITATHPYLPQDIESLSRPPSPLQQPLDGAFFNMTQVGSSQQPLQMVSISDMLALDTASTPQNNRVELHSGLSSDSMYSHLFADNYGSASSMSFSNSPEKPEGVSKYVQNRNNTLPPHVTGFNTPQTRNIIGKGLQIRVLGVPESGAKSRVETQVKFCLQLVTDRGEKVSLWSHLRLPEFMVAKEKFKRKNAKDQTSPTEQNVLNLETNVICASDVTRKVYTCISCVQRERKRALRKRESKSRNQQASVDNTPCASRASSPVNEPGISMDDEQSLQLEQRRILLFNCSELVDFSSGDTILPARITCYCRHHNEKVGFCIFFILKDYLGQEIATGISPPIMITDDHKSNKGKAANRRQNRKSEYEIPVRNSELVHSSGQRLNSTTVSSIPASEAIPPRAV